MEGLTDIRDLTSFRDRDASGKQSTSFPRDETGEILNQADGGASMHSACLSTNKASPEADRRYS